MPGQTSKPHFLHRKGHVAGMGWKSGAMKKRPQLVFTDPVTCSPWRHPGPQQHQKGQVYSLHLGSSFV